MNTIEVHALRKVFPNGHEALKNISFNVAPGEMVAIIGRSGAGKSTLLRCLNGILPATSGRIAINGLDLTSASAQTHQLRRRIGFVYQDYNLVERSHVFRNVISGRAGRNVAAALGAGFVSAD